MMMSRGHMMMSHGREEHDDEPWWEEHDDESWQGEA